MECQTQFSGKKKKKNIINLSSAEFAQRGIKVKNGYVLMLVSDICHWLSSK